MARNIADLRFVVGGPTWGYSSIWRYWITRNGDIYLAQRGTARHFKVSFHRSGICRYAFTEQHGRPASMGDRLMHRWQRPDIPAAGSGKFARLAWLALPTDYLSLRTVTGITESIIFPPANSGAATFIETGLTNDPELEIANAMGQGNDRGIASFAVAFNETAPFVRWYHGAWENKDLTMPASHGRPAYRFLASEAVHRDRPIRLTMQQPTKDKDALLITELGGCEDAA